MNVRLVAYRPATTAATSDSTYQLDLQESPNISLNFQFADIKEPDKRKASYSQTFKIPFTQKNNAFFQTWFNVNLETPVFNSRKRFAAVLYVGTVPQFEGVIQLKGVFLKAGYYDVLLMSTSADLFTKIGSQKLKDVFKTFNSLGEFTGYSRDLNHKYNEDNLAYSWNGASSSFKNFPEDVSLRDADSGVQKVMYPFSFTKPRAWFNSTKQHLNLDQTEIDSIGYSEAGDIMTDLLQFRPAIQIKEVFKRILAKAGFSYTSSFIDGNYFGNLFMTTCNNLTTPGPVQKMDDWDIDGFMSVGNSAAFHTYSYAAGFDFDCFEPEWVQVKADTTDPIDTALYSAPYDPNDLWNAGAGRFHKTSPNMVECNIQFVVKYENIRGVADMTYSPLGPAWTCDTEGSGGGLANEILWEIEVYAWNGMSSDLVAWWEQWTPMAYEPALTVDNYALVSFDIDLFSVPVGQECWFRVRPRFFAQATAGTPSTITLGATRCMPGYIAPATFPACAAADYLFDGLYNKITVTWAGEEKNMYGSVVDVPAGIDDKLTQKGFLKDLMQRFNLVIIADPNNPDNLIIEPYNDYIGSGTLKDWTDKLDTSKEVVIRDTTSMQKSRVLFTDLEDNDLWNKSIREEAPQYNVYGKMDIRETNNEFATGEMKNDPMFSPYINEKIFAGNNEEIETVLGNVAAHYEYTYKKVEGGYEDVLEATEPKIFYYSGTPTTITGADKIYLQHVDAYTGQVLAHEFTQYPLCSPFELTSASDGTSTITTSTRSLHWNLNGPLAGQLSCFNYLPDSDVIAKSLYFTYWFAYLNGLYDTEARLMECHLNLNEVDIYNFKFSDEIFIKDTYWRIIKLENYQVGANVSTKATLLKIDEGYDTVCFGCEYVVGSLGGSNTLGPFYLWCSSSDADCTPNLTSGGSYAGLYASPVCCECNGGTPFYWATAFASSGLYPCIANTGSLPYQMHSIYSTRSIVSTSTTKSLISGKLNGLNKPILVGNNTTKYTNTLFPYFGNDIVIKYSNTLRNTPLLNGESHRIVLSGNTNGNTRGYAYVEGNSNQQKIPTPVNTNIIIRVKGTATVVGGTSSSYPLGTLEGFAYYTAFKNIGGAVTQLSTAGGQQEFSIREGANPTTCTLHISASGGVINFGLDDSQTDTRRLWVLTVDVDVNSVVNLERNFDDDKALYQNLNIILLQNGNDLIWN